MRPQVLRRITKELTDLRSNPPDGFCLLFDEKLPSISILGYFIGPIDTPYSGGLFTFTLTYPEEYPFKPPVFKLHTSIFHPAIKNERVCLDILRDQWSPALTVPKVLGALQGLLGDPNFDDFINEEAAEAGARGIFGQEAELATLRFAH